MPTSSSTVRVQWEGPQNEADVEGYIITYQPETTVTCDGVKGGEVEIGAGMRGKDVTGLEEGTDYIIHVAAYNSIGEGEHSDDIGMC